jgi:hypothetical protein
MGAPIAEGALVYDEKVSGKRSAVLMAPNWFGASDRALARDWWRKIGMSSLSPTYVVRLRGPQIALEFRDHDAQCRVVLMHRDRREEIARIDEAVRAQRAAIQKCRMPLARGIA